MKTIVLIAILLALSGCANTQVERVESIKADLIVLGKIKSDHEFDVANRDLIEIWNGYTFEIYNKKEKVIYFISSGEKCVIKNYENKFFLVFLNEKSFISGDHKDKKYQAIMCIPIDEETMLDISGGVDIF